MPLGNSASASWLVCACRATDTDTTDEILAAALDHAKLMRYCAKVRRPSSGLVRSSTPAPSEVHCASYHGGASYGAAALLVPCRAARLLAVRWNVRRRTYAAHRSRGRAITASPLRAPLLSTQLVHLCPQGDSIVALHRIGNASVIKIVDIR